MPAGSSWTSTTCTPSKVDAVFSSQILNFCTSVVWALVLVFFNIACLRAFFFSPATYLITSFVSGVRVRWDPIFPAKCHNKRTKFGKGYLEKPARKFPPCRKGHMIDFIASNQNHLLIVSALLIDFRRYIFLDIDPTQPIRRIYSRFFLHSLGAPDAGFFWKKK